jgi:hypothetical protein
LAVIHSADGKCAALPARARPVQAIDRAEKTTAAPLKPLLPRREQQMEFIQGFP